jgi:hypothetical protein
MLLHECFPLCDFFVTPVESSVDGKAYRTAEVKARDQIMRYGVAIIAVIVVPIHILEQAADVLTQRVVKD